MAIALQAKLPMLSNMICPVCARGALAVDRSLGEVGQENEAREAFVKRRLGHRPEYMESMDLTRFMHGGPGRLLTCQICGTILRDERAPSGYEDDVYDSALMEHLYPRYAQAFENKRAQYLPLLRQGAEVLEVGSHLGAFLQTAEEWGWRPTGLDIGRSTSSFARHRGLSVKRLTMEDYSPRLRRPEAIFIWNCFEQLEDPAGTLRRARELLDRRGVLVVRVPNAEFYRQQRQWRSRRSLNLLGYHKLLGFPYLHGYTPATLAQILSDSGFEPIATHNSSLLTPPYPEMSRQMHAEWRQARVEAERPAQGSGPWLELVSRGH